MADEMAKKLGADGSKIAITAELHRRRWGWQRPILRQAHHQLGHGGTHKS